MAIQTRPPETTDARKTRQFAALRTLGELAMDLAQDAHALAKQQLAPRAPNAPRAPANIGTDYAHIFAILSRAVRQAIAHELRLEAGPRARPAFRPAGELAIRPPDPRRPLLRSAFHAAVAADPDRARLRRTIDQHIDHILEADPDQRRDIGDILEALMKSLGIKLDLARAPDALIGMPARDRFAEARASPTPSP